MSGTSSTTSSVTCTNCGGQLDINDMQETIVCPYCGTKYSVSDLRNESDTVKAERIRVQAAREAESERLRQTSEREKREEEKNELEQFKKSKFSKVLIVFAVFSLFLCATAFSDGHILAGITAVIMTALFFLSWLMGMQIIKEKKKGIHTITAIAAFILIFPYFSFNQSKHSSLTDNPEKFAWSDIEMHKVLPEPENTFGTIHHNSKTDLMLTLSDLSEKDFKAYRDTCISAGYETEADESSISYSAYNQDGYEISLIYYQNNEELNVTLTAPEEMDEFEWPSNGLAAMLPATKSKIGNITSDSSENFSVHVGNTPIEEYDTYVKECEKKGFTVDYDKGEKSYSALNADKYQLHLEYSGFQTITISLEAPEEDTDDFKDKNDSSTTESTETSASAKEQTSSEENDAPPEENTSSEENAEKEEAAADGISPDFKKAMDSYEAFFDEYVDFMEKYLASDGTDLTLITKYADYMSKYTQCLKDLEAWENEEMNTAEAAYYLEVQNRINQKLLKISQ